MSKAKLKCLSLLLILSLFVGLVGIVNVDTSYAASKKIHIKKKTVTIVVGKTYQQKLINKKGKTIKATKVKWKSSNKKIAKINKKGKITAVKKGTVKMTAKYKGKTYKFTVKVKKPSNKRVKVQPSSLTVIIGETKSVTVTINGVDSVSYSANRIVDCSWGDWKTANSCDLYIKGVSEGKTTITLFDTNNSSVSTTLTVNVVPPALEISTPTMPASYSYHNPSTLLLYSECRIDKVEFEKHYYSYDNSYRVTLCLIGEKTYDYKPTTSSDCKVGYKLYDANGYVVKSGTFYSDSVTVGEKFKGSTIIASDLSPGKYRLELLNVV